MMDWMLTRRLLLLVMMTPTGAFAGRLTPCSPERLRRNGIVPFLNDGFISSQLANSGRSMI
jgi:hypothetical protein